MSQSPVAVGTRSRAERNGDGDVIDAEDAIQDVLDVLTDADSRAILEAVGEADDGLSAAELSETCDVPLSTTYRKLDRLTEAGLLAERVRIRRSGNHETAYERRVEDVRIAVDSEAGLEMRVSRRDGANRTSPAGEGW